MSEQHINIDTTKENYIESRDISNGESTSHITTIDAETTMPNVEKIEEVNIELSPYYPRAIGKPSTYYPIRNDSNLSQTAPPTITLAEFYKDTRMPIGLLMDHNLDSNTYRITSAELREKDLLRDDEWNEVREAAEAHRQTRYHLHNVIRPGMSLMEITRIIEKSNLDLLGVNGPGDLRRGYGFPTGVSVNHVAAHFSPNTGDTTILQDDDILKVDYGTHVNGRIIDSAFTVHFNSVFDPLAEAAKEATNAGIKAAGIDMRLGDIGGIIQEVMESYEVEMNGKILPVRCIPNFNGHSIKKYKIHGGKTVPCRNNGDQTKMEEGEFFAIETFGTTGRGAIMEGNDCSHYVRNPKSKSRPRTPESVRKLFDVIEKNFSTLPFCRKWLDDMGHTNHLLALRQLVKQGSVIALPALVEEKGVYSSQFEHTILLRPNVKEVLSKGYDY